MAENKNYHDELNKKKYSEAPGAAGRPPALLQTVFPRDRGCDRLPDTDSLCL